jgi:hypothetical protein
MAPFPFLTTYYEKHHHTSSVVYASNKAEEKLPQDSQEVDGLLSLGGSHSKHHYT